MSTSILSFIICAVGAIGISAIFAGWIVYKFRAHFTREVFLRCWIIAVVCFSLLVIGIFYDANTFTKTFAFLTWSDLPDGTAAGFLGLLIIWIVIILSAKFLFFNWTGKKSILQYEEEIGDRNQDIGLALSAILRRDVALKPWNGFKTDAITPLIPSYTNSEKPWHIHAAELLLLVEPQYKINLGTSIDFEKNDWYETEQCYISAYGNKNLIVGIFCNKEEPTFGALERFSKFVQQQTKDGKSYKLIALIEEGDQQEKEFINLVGPIEFRYKEELVRILMQQFHKYRNHVFHKYETESIELGSSTTISQIYVEPSGQQMQRTLKEAIIPPKVPIPTMETYLQDWLEDKSIDNKRQIALLGEYGQGKSVLSLSLAHTLFKTNITPDRLPIIFELRGMSPRSFRSQLEFLSVWAVNYDVLPKVVLKLHELGRLLLIFEGFDEMDLVGNYEVRLNHFQKIWSFSRSNSKIIITGRPNYFLNDKELTTLLRTHQDAPHLPYCEEVHLDMFSLPQIEKALRYKSVEKRNEIMAVLKASPEHSGFRDLMKRPTLLFIAGTIWEEESLNEKGSQINSAYIMERFLEYSYKRQQDKLQKSTINQFAESKPILEVSERAYFMMGIAVAMAKEKNYTNQIKQVDLNEVVIKLINGFDPIITQKSKQRFYHSSFQERIEEMDAKKSILRDVISCGILVRDFSGDDLFKFAHKSFLEFLVSRFYVSLLLKRKQSDLYQHIANAVSITIKINLLTINHTADTAKFTGELLVNEAEINSEDYKVNAKKLFRFLYPVKILDRFPQIAFPSLKSFLWGGLFGGLMYILAAILATIVHIYLGLSIQVLLVTTFFLFGLRRWFRVGEVFGMLFIGIIVTGWLEELTHLPFSENASQLLSLIDNDLSGESNHDSKEIVILFTLIGFAFLITKFFLIKSTGKNSWNLIAFENDQIDKLLQLWVIACNGIGVPDKYLLKFMSKKKLKTLKKIGDI